MDWREDYFRLFISHVATTKKLVSDVAIILEANYGIHGFVAHADIQPSADWQNDIESALVAMDSLLAFFSPGFSTSEWCNQEVGWALGQDTPIITLRADEDPSGFVGRFQAIPLKSNEPREISKSIFQLLASNHLTAEKISLATSKRLLNANQWEDIRFRIVPCIEELTKFPDQSLNDFEAAFRDNEYIYTSYYVDSVKAILRKHGRSIPDPSK